MNAPMTGMPLHSPRTLFAAADPQTAGGFTLADALRLLFKHKWTILLCFAGVTLALAFGLASLPPSYVTSAKVLVKIEEGGNPSFFSGIAPLRDSTVDDPANRKIENDMEMAETWPVAAEVVTELGLTYDQVYQSPLLHLMRPVGNLVEWITNDLLGMPADPERRGFTDTVVLLLKSFEVKPVASKSADTNSNIIGFTLQGSDPERARRTLDALVRTYIDHVSRIRQDAAQKAFEIVSARLAAAQGDIAAVQQRLEHFLSDSGASSGGVASATPDGSGSRRDGSRLQGLVTPRDATTLAQLKGRLIDMQVHLAELQSTTRGPSEQSAALKAAIATLVEQMDREQRRSAQNEAALIEIERDLHFKEASLMELQQRLSQIRLFLDMGASQISNRVVVEPPLRPRGSEWKQRVMTGILGAFGGLFLGIGLAGMREFVDRRLENDRDVERHLGFPVLTVIPLTSRSAAQAALDGAALLRRTGGTIHARTG